VWGMFRMEMHACMHARMACLGGKTKQPEQGTCIHVTFSIRILDSNLLFEIIVLLML